MTRRVEVNPGEMFAVSDKVILISEYESVLGMTEKIGVEGEPKVAYFLTFKGKLNNRDRSGDVTVAMSPQDAWQLTGDLLNGLELLAKAGKEASE